MAIEKKTRKVRKNSMGWMIQRIARRLDDAMTERLSEHGMTLQQFAVMMIVLENNGMTQREIGDNFGMPPYAISRALDALEEMGFLKRRQHPTSRRTHLIHSTKKGRKLGPELFTIVKEVNQDLAATLSSSEAKKFKNLLTKVETGGETESVA